MEEVHGSGVLVYLSATWLSELYQQVLACNLLEKCGYNPHYTENSALINVLTGKRNPPPRMETVQDVIRIIEESVISVKMSMGFLGAREAGSFCPTI